MTPGTIGAIGVAAMLVMLLLRIPVAFAMFLVGFSGIWVLNGWNAAASLLASETFTLATNPELVIIPLFILMGNVASETGMSRQLYDAAYAVVGRIRGGLASATVIGMIPLGQNVEVHGIELMAQEKRIQGAIMGSNRFRIDFPRLVDLYKQDRLKLDELVSDRIGLDGVTDALQNLKDNKGSIARQVVVFD